VTQEDGDFDRAFGTHLGSIMKISLEKLRGLNLKDYASVLNTDEKVAILTCLIDGIHDL